MVKEIVAYQTSDKILHLDENKAQKHQKDIVGEALDNLVQHDSRGNISRADRHSLLINTLENDKFRENVRSLYNAVFFAD